MPKQSLKQQANPLEKYYERIREEKEGKRKRNSEGRGEGREKCKSPKSIMKKEAARRRCLGSIPLLKGGIKRLRLHIKKLFRISEDQFKGNYVAIFH